MSLYRHVILSRAHFSKSDFISLCITHPASWSPTRTLLQSRTLHYHLSEAFRQVFMRSNTMSGGAHPTSTLRTSRSSSHFCTMDKETSRWGPGNVFLATPMSRTTPHSHSCPTPILAIATVAALIKVATMGDIHSETDLLVPVLSPRALLATNMTQGSPLFLLPTSSSNLRLYLPSCHSCLKWSYVLVLLARVSSTSSWVANSLKLKLVFDGSMLSAHFKSHLLAP